MKSTSSPADLRPTRYDALVAAAVLVLAIAVAVAVYAPARAGGEEPVVVVTASGEEVYRLPLRQFPDAPGTFTHNGYTLTLRLDASGSDSGVYVAQSDCPGHDCVHMGVIRRTGQSIVCLPAQIVIRLEGGSGGPDLTVG